VKEEAQPKHRPAAIVCCETNQNQKEKAMKKATFHTLAGLLAIGLVFGVNFAHAQAGTLDPTFGTVESLPPASPMASQAWALSSSRNGDIVAVAQVDFVNNVGTGIGLAALYLRRRARHHFWNERDHRHHVSWHHLRSGLCLRCRLMVTFWWEGRRRTVKV
jgi:hypothetical protein